MLDDDQLRAAWQVHAQSVIHDKWRTNYRKQLEAIAGASRSELATRDWQERLWKDRSMTPVGPGDSVNVTALYDDRAIVDRVIDLRSMSLPADTEQRARAIQAAYNSLLEQIAATHKVRVKPAAKLLRIFASMLPRELTCVLSYEPNQNAAELLLGQQKRAHLELHVLMRQRLRSVLGPEHGGLEEDVLRSTFCWWLHENREALKSTGAAAQETHADPPQPAETDVLVLWPFGKQFKANATGKGFDRYYRDLVQAAVAGVPRDELVAMLRADEQYAHLQPQSIRQVISTVKGLGLLEEHEGLLRPTPTGEELLEVEEPDVLVRVFIERVFGYAQLLRLLGEQRDGLPTSDVVRTLQAIYPNWTSTRAPLALLGWSDALGLVDEVSENRWSLSDYGRGWAARLPAQLPTPPKEAIVTELESDESSAPSAIAFPRFDEIHAELQRAPEGSTFVFERALVAALDAGWRLSERKRFVILSGLSGTGKTAITRCYARAVCSLMDIDLHKHFAVVPVSPDWRDPTSLFGYFNALSTDPTYQPEVTLRLLLQANADPTRPYFLVLDEMNLARVERYFAPMLSAMETGLPLDLHANAGPVNGVPPTISWPKNLYIAGTVNMDESTHPFSDKVLDRAVALEFWDVDLPSFFERRTSERDPVVEALLIELYGLLRPVRRHFGYRTAGEVLDFVARMTASGENGGLDLAVFGKILPRLRGEQTPGLEGALSGVEKLCAKHQLQRCRAKLEIMIDELRQTGMTRFWA